MLKHGSLERETTVFSVCNMVPSRGLSILQVLATSEALPMGVRPRKLAGR